MMRSILLSCLFIFSAFQVQGQCSATIFGNIQICSGESGDLTVTLTGTPPWSFTYAVNGSPVTINNVFASPYSLQVSQAGTYTLLEVSATGCSMGTVSGAGTVTEFPSPTAWLIGGGDEVCEGTSDLMVNLTGAPPWTIGYHINGVPQPSINIVINPYNLPAPTEGFYILSNVADENGCLGTVSGTADVTFHDPPQATNLQINSNTTSQTYELVFEIIDGDPFTYSVVPFNGSLAGNVFTSNPMQCDDGYVFVIDDNFSCAPQTISENSVTCECLSQAGQMGQAPIDICGDGPITAFYDDTDEVLDADDITHFYLHTSNNLSIGTIVGDNNTPSFSFDPATMNYGQTYYISAVVGNDDGNGQVDLADPCLSVSQGTPVVFYNGNILGTGLDYVLTCSEPSATLITSFTGGQPPYVSFFWTGPNGFTSVVPAPTVSEPGPYTLVISDAVGCTGSTTLNVLGDIDQPICNIVYEPLSCINTEVEVIPDCLNGTPPYSYVWSGGQTTPTGIFDSPGTYIVTITDGIGCSALMTFTILFSDEGCGHINGNVRSDENMDCTADANEDPLQSWTIKASDGTDDYFDLTNTDGFYEIAVPPGDFNVEIINNLPDFWDACSPSANVMVDDELDVETVDFPLQKLIDCPIMEVDISTPFLRRCFTNYFFVNYCNNGTTEAIGATIEVTFDLDFTVHSSGVPFTNPEPGVYVFEIGDVGIGQCGDFTINTTLSCNAVLGETICTEAHIYPDTSCIEPDPLWSGASLQITSECVGGEVIFTITNTGVGDMSEPSYFIVIEDGVMLTIDPVEVLLLAGASTEITYPANGSTYILQLDQVSNHPGFSAPLQALEGCGVNGVGSFSTGFVTQFPENDADPFLSIDCQIVIGSYDPNDKYGYPEGYGDEHFIDLGQDLEYRIRFQNTGTDTAFKVVIQDVLSPLLDITTLRPGASSHPYELSVLGSDTLVFTFNDILLPDSNINEALSHGFVKFRIGQSPTSALGDVIENEAAIYFDFNDPVITNKTVHKIGEHFIMTATDEVQHPLIQHIIQPNPTSGQATLTLSGQVPFGEMTVNLFGTTGQLVHSETLLAPIGKLHFGSLKTGLYFYEIRMQEGVIGRGRLVIN